MKKSSKNLILGTGFLMGAAAVAAGVSSLITHTLVNESLNRVEPKPFAGMKNLFMGEALKSPEVIEAMKKGEELARKDLETVEITAYDGIKLIGHICRAENQKRVLIAMHGWRSTWYNDFAAISDFWHNNGCTVLYVEQRAQGESDGEYMGFGLIERFDCLEWIKYLNANGFSDVPMYLVGISMGASSVLMTSGFDDLPENICGIISDCAFVSPYAIWKNIVEKNMKLFYRPLEREVDILCRRRLALTADGYSTTEALQKNTIPVMFIHGDSDGFVPVEMTYENYNACTAPKRMLIVKGADHGMSYLKAKDVYEQNVLDFWAKHDKKVSKD